MDDTLTDFDVIGSRLTVDAKGLLLLWYVMLPLL
jgi:hypothetical protein